MAKTIANDITTSYAGLRTLLGKIQSNLCDVCLNSAGLAIGTSSKKKVKVVNTTYVMLAGALKSVAAATEVALSGTVTNALFNVFVLSVSDTDTVTATMGTEGATLGAVVFPTVPANEAVIGFVSINPTGTGGFVGATTDLDDATVVPNAVYYNTPFPINANSLSL